MFVGDTGIGRVIRRTLEVMNALRTDDPAAIRRAGAIDLPLLQKYINFWFTSSLDLFGGEDSSNAASAFANGLKGRPDEAGYADHSEKDTHFELDVPAADWAGAGEGLGRIAVPMRNGINEQVRQAYVKDCEIGFKRWNRTIERAGWNVRLGLPSTRFRRGIGVWAGVPTDPGGRRITQAQYDANMGDWIPTEQDKAFVRSLMVKVHEPGKMASWIAPPERGINNLPVDYQYVHLQ